MSKGNTYTDEFKDEATQLAFSLGSTSQAAKNLNIPKATLHTWVKETKSQGSSSTSRPPQIDVNVLQEEIKELRQRLSRVEQEKSILKKAAVYFAKEQQ